MEDIWYNLFINDLQNMEYKIEDVVLHVLTGVMLGVTLKAKAFFVRAKNFFF